jgi:hypothetical protein
MAAYPKTLTVSSDNFYCKDAEAQCSANPGVAAASLRLCGENRMLFNPTHAAWRISILPVALFIFMLMSLLTCAQGISEEEQKKANNPLANTKALNLQNYYVPTLYDDSNLKANTALIRYAMPFANGKVLMRATLPLGSTPSGGYAQNGAPNYSSGLGDLNFFATYTFSKPDAKTLLGVGPQVVIPTASSHALGAGKWQLGAAFIAFNAASPVLQWGALITYQTSIAGDEDRVSTALLVMQPFLIFQLGKGAYLRSTALWNFNLYNNAYNVPLGVGAGHVAKAGNLLFNIFLEPQFTVLHEGAGQPALQFFGGINCQF